MDGVDRLPYHATRLRCTSLLAPINLYVYAIRALSSRLYLYPTSRQQETLASLQDLHIVNTRIFIYGFFRLCAAVAEKFDLIIIQQRSTKGGGAVFEVIILDSATFQQYKTNSTLYDETGNFSFDDRELEDIIRCQIK